MSRPWRIKKWEKAWLVVSLVVLLGLVARVALIQAEKVRYTIAWQEKLAAPFENPVCAPLLKAPVEQLPRLETLGEAESPCFGVVAFRLWRHKHGQPSEVRADEFRSSRWQLVKDFFHLRDRQWVELRDFSFLAMAFLPSLYGVGLIATGIWKLAARRSAENDVVLH